ncbi:MAG: sulfatase-like hydrolase/transferase [Planctomycetes bacterium]|nr:sulfatase-like hydrolase/transferase [Planctomycetota bacterium]
MLAGRNLVLTVAALTAAVSSVSAVDFGAIQPNVILVFIDDMGWADLSCFGSRDATTPNIDRMASEGIAFEQFYVNSPICSPSRVAISTGQYPQRWGITSYLASRRKNAERGLANWLDPAAPMLARSLKAAGYATGHFGKWHMGGQRDVAEAPPIAAYGFDASLTNFEGMGPKLLPLTMKPGWEKPGRIWADAERLGGPVQWRQRSTITGGFVEAALGFIKEAESGKIPFYINLWPDDVHSPFWPSVGNWRDNKRELYCAVLEEMDEQLGRLFDYVRDRESLRDNTLVLICSDNGHELGAGQAGPLKGCKTHLYEGGIRSPLIVWGPGVVEKRAAGTRNKTSVFAAIDLVPSLLRLTGGEPPAGVTYDGEELLGTLLGRTQTSRQAPIFFSRPPDRKNFYGFQELPDLALRQGRWKLLCDYDGARPQLYDLTLDIGESNNLVENHPEVAEELRRKVVGWYKSTNVVRTP